jgi:hypothetical protein
MFTALPGEQERACQNNCMNNLKQIGLSLLNYEDKRKALPPISSNFDPIADVPGFATGTTQGGAPGAGQRAIAGLYLFFPRWKRLCCIKILLQIRRDSRTRHSILILSLSTAAPAATARTRPRCK